MMNTVYKAFVSSFIFCLITINVCAQDFIRIGISGDFNKSTVVQTFSIDLNRTEKVDEKVGKYLLYNRSNYFILPAIDINLGEKTTSAENNITALINMGKKYLGNPVIDNRVTKKINGALEFNPTFSSDKSFEEKLLFGQIKGLLNGISSHTNQKDIPFIDRGFSLSGGVFSNLGVRRSNLYDQGSFYFTGGLLSEVKWQFLKKTNENDENEDPYANWIVKFSGNYYYLFADMDALYSKDFAGAVKFTINKNVYKYLYTGLTYKLGNDNPKYTGIHTLELAVKINY